MKDYLAKRNEDLKQNSIDSITSRSIIDRHKWDMWCNTIKNTKIKHPYSENFTNDKMFEILIRRCFYCDDIATTIDRIDSKLDHTLENCVGCCWGCNNSKGAADSSTFIRKAYYRARGKYHDDDINIWFVYKQKPRMCQYKQNAGKKGVNFELTNKDFDVLIKGDCEYCHRSPATWFGIDRLVPSLGYVTGNTVSCCFDCNVDKHESDVEMMMKRNERIAKRVADGDLAIGDCDKMILHKGTNKTSKKVCARGKLYASKREASGALGKGDVYVCECIRVGRHSEHIFEITERFYKEYKDSELYITNNMFVSFEYFHIA